MLDLAFPVWRGLRRSSRGVVTVWLALQPLFFGGCSGSRTNPAACLPSPSPELVLPPATGGTSNATQVVGAGGTALEAVIGTEEPEIEDDNSPVTGPSFDAPVPDPVASPHSPALLRKGASCWIYDDSIPGPPVVVYLNVGTAVVYHGKCWVGYFGVVSTATRPFHAPEMASTAMGCPYVEEQGKPRTRFDAFVELIHRAYDIRIIQGRPRLLGAKGQRLASLRAPNQDEMAKHCPLVDSD